MSSPKDIAVFIDRHLSLLKNERDMEVEQTGLVLSRCAPKLLEQRGLALLNLSVAGINVGLGGKSIIELERSNALSSNPNFPPHSFRPGDVAQIEAHSASSTTAPRKQAKQKQSANSSDVEQRKVEGVVSKVTDSKVFLSVDPQHLDSKDAELPDRCRLVKLANSVTYDRMDKTMLLLKALMCEQDSDAKSRPSVKGSPQLVNVLLGVSKPSRVQALNGVKFFDDKLNSSQQEAIRYALGSPEVACIHGPPGTGKTHTLIEIIRQIIFKPDGTRTGKRVLVCGASNLSVDNILERLLALQTADHAPIKCTRVGHPARVKAIDITLRATLDSQVSNSDQAELIRDVKLDLSNRLSILAGNDKSQKGKRPRGPERKKLWEEVRDLRKEYRKREKGMVQSIIKEAEVILATTHSAGGHALQDMKFDVVIIDEATQALEASCWIPILKGDKLILAGDPLQLPPTVLSVDKKIKKSPEKKAETKPASKSKLISSRSKKTGLRPPNSLEVTLFERLEKTHGASIKRMLQVQYRMHDTICDFPNKTLYGSKLQSHESVAKHTLEDLPTVSDEENHNSQPDSGIHDVLGFPVVFFDTAGCEYFEKAASPEDDGSKSNENEAVLVKNWVDQLVSAGIHANQIAVLSPYQAQVTLLSSSLSPEYPELEVGTVDGMQGREKEAVIISLVRSNEKREVGFLKDKRRLNVAMTRARRQLCVIGDSSTVQTGSDYLKKWMKWLEDNADVRYGGTE
ncbi:P-loop containing nucleoside triphosphate hydrolase protein [Schizopora paradoxa]|uniref:DNA helicase n=1 Tax=Schizopora paradoxa TaxID=27342 RepID=A0A0H2S3K5_9AGAM|nr:P-loop containing nucleoside triphosphate hydrolase protein [Schizopora paradoxa]